MRRRVLSSFVMVAATGLLAALPVGAGAGAAYAAPEPSVIPVSWELSFEHGPIERLIVPVNGKSETFWYMRYTVTNNTGQDILFTPDFQLMTDTGQVREAFDGVPDAVFKKVKALYKNLFLMSPTGILGKLLQGADNAKDGVLIFSGVDPNAREFHIFVEGLSGETAEVKNPVNGKTVILQKTLDLDYNVPGQAIGIEPHPQLRATTWVMK